MNTRWDHAANFPPMRRGTLPMRLADNLRRRILSRELGPGSRLPPLRTLARLHDVSVPTVREAMQRLREAGLVTVEPGRGMYVQRGLAPLHSLDLALLDAGTSELAALRALIDGDAAERAARAFELGSAAHWDRSDLDRWAHERALLGQSLPDFVVADSRFHAEVARIGEAKGLVLASLRDTIEKALRLPLLAAGLRLARDDELSRLHVGLAAAIACKDHSRATVIGRTIARRERVAIVAAAANGQRLR